MNGFEFEDVQGVVEFMYKGEVMVGIHIHLPTGERTANDLEINKLCYGGIHRSLNQQCPEC
jgi:hypothetical protein